MIALEALRMLGDGGDVVPAIDFPAMAADEIGIISTRVPTLWTAIVAEHRGVDARSRVFEEEKAWEANGILDPAYIDALVTR